MYMKLYEVTFGMRLYLEVSLFMGKYSNMLTLLVYRQGCPQVGAGGEIPPTLVTGAPYFFTI